MGIEDEVLMGMGIKAVKAEQGGFEILTPGSRVTLGADGTLTIQQLIGANRKLVSCSLPAHLSPWRLSGRTPFRCVLEGNGLRLTIQGDGFVSGTAVFVLLFWKRIWFIMIMRINCGFDSANHQT